MRHDFISLCNSYSANTIHSTNRKLIALTQDTLRKISEEQKKILIAYIKDYCRDIPVENDVFKISDNKQFKKLLYGLDERFYTTYLSRQRRMANSVQRLIDVETI